MSRINAFLELTVQQKGSDLHVISGLTPRIRINGRLEPVRFRELTTSDINSILSEFMTPAQRAALEERHSVDFAYVVEGLGRFRVNVYHQLRGIAAVFRFIPNDVPSLEQLDMPPVIRATAAAPQGLTLVTGPTGSGKSTTLAAIINQINLDRKGHIITIEDPIEFIHGFKNSVVTQREIGSDAPSFREALRAAVREDPDVVLVGEMRDLETISLALTAAETGVQVLATLHTNGAIRSVDRLISVFPARRQEQVRTVLADSLRMVVSQQLVRRADGAGRKAVLEILLNTQSASSMIRGARTHQLGSVIQANRRIGMQSLDEQLEKLVRDEIITGPEAYERSIEKTKFERFLLQESMA